MDLPAAKVVLGNSSLAKLVPSLSKRYRVIVGWEAQDPTVYLGAGVLIVAGDVPLDFTLLEMMPALRLVACATRGYDAIDIDWLAKSGIEFTHAVGVNDEDVADHALGTIIMHRRALIEGSQALREGRWDGGGMTNRSLVGTRLGIVGLGLIGSALARRASAFRMSVRWWAPNTKLSPWPRAASLVELARSSEILAITARSHDNDGLISADVIDALGPQGFLVNVARGQLVDEDALIGALRTCRLGGAALDVFENEPTPASRWADVPNTFLTPHMSGKTQEAFGRMARQLGSTLDDFFGGVPRSESGHTTQLRGADLLSPSHSEGAREACLT